MALNLDNTIVDDLEWNPELSEENFEAIDQMLQNNIWTDMNGGLEILWYINFWINVLYVALFIASAIWLYKLSKKLGDKHSWLAFIPLIQIYTYIKTAWYGFWKWLIMLILYSILALFISGIALVWLVPLLSTLTSWGDTSSVIIVILVSTVFITLLMILIATFFLYAGMAKRAWQSKTTAILMALFPWCMLWKVANRVSQKPLTDHVSNVNTIEQTPVINTEL